MSRLFAGLTVTVFLSTGIAWAKLPRAYFGLASVGAAGGYHGWTDTAQGLKTAWWDVNGAAIEARWILNSGLGFGLRVMDVTGVVQSYDWTDPQPRISSYVEIAPSILWVAHHSDHGFGYIELQLMPWADGASGASLDYGYVPWAPVPIELRARAAATRFSWEPDGQIGYNLAAGFRIGLGWWLIQKERPLKM
jgi:hypothetical protein